MAPVRRVTEKLSQLVASVARGCPHPSPSLCWVGGIWRPRQGPQCCVAHTHTSMYRETHKAWSHPGWTHDHHGRHSVTKPLTEEGGLGLRLCEGSHLGSDPPHLTDSFLLWERQAPLDISSPWRLQCCLCSSELERFTSACAHRENHVRNQSQQVAGLAQRSRQAAKVKHTGHSFSAILPGDDERK